MGRDLVPFLPSHRAELGRTFDFFHLTGLLALNDGRGLLHSGCVLFLREAMDLPISESTVDRSSAGEPDTAASAAAILKGLLSLSRLASLPVAAAAAAPGWRNMIGVWLEQIVGVPHRSNSQNHDGV